MFLGGNSHTGGGPRGGGAEYAALKCSTRSSVSDLTEHRGSRLQEAAHAVSRVVAVCSLYDPCLVGPSGDAGCTVAPDAYSVTPTLVIRLTWYRGQVSCRWCSCTPGRWWSCTWSATTSSLSAGPMGRGVWWALLLFLNHCLDCCTPSSQGFFKGHPLISSQLASCKGLQLSVKGQPHGIVQIV